MYGGKPHAQECIFQRSRPSKIKSFFGYYFSSAHSRRPHLLLYAPPTPNYFFTAPNDEITFSRPSNIKNDLFTAPSNNNSLPCFFYSFKQNSTYSLFENSFQQKVLSYKPVNCSMNRMAIFYIVQIESYF